MSASQNEKNCCLTREGQERKASQAGNLLLPSASKLRNWLLSAATREIPEEHRDLSLWREWDCDRFQGDRGRREGERAPWIGGGERYREDRRGETAIFESKGCFQSPGSGVISKKRAPEQRKLYKEEKVRHRAMTNLSAKKQEEKEKMQRFAFTLEASKVSLGTKGSWRTANKETYGCFTAIPLLIYARKGPQNLKGEVPRAFSERRGSGTLSLKRPLRGGYRKNIIQEYGTEEGMKACCSKGIRKEDR